jgi:hypothetical protein
MTGIPMFSAHCKRLTIECVTHLELGLMMGIAAATFGAGVGLGVKAFKYFTR